MSNDRPATTSPRRLRVPGYLRDKGTGQARVLIDGKHIFLGPYGSAESKARCRKLVRVAREAARPPRKAPRSPVLLNEL